MSFKLSDVGNHIENIDVIISYKIIELFSGQLYSSPLKAIEELVVNAYDAFANHCFININIDNSKTNNIAIFDDGEGMDLEGLKELWLIADSRKRDPDRESSSIKQGRLPVGKFGIGKLASYIVGNRITHLTKKANRYLVVTMDYRNLENISEGERLPLSIREVSSKEALNILDKIFIEYHPFKILKNKKEPNSWTLVVIEDLKPKSLEISVNRLNWIVSTALPLVPDFKCFLNFKEVKPSKLDKLIMKEWIIGKEDKIADKLNYTPYYYEKDEEKKKYQISIEGVGNIWGKFELYHDSISTGKSELYSRSNGFFIMVRGRLINLKDAYFGLPVLSHSTFSRFRAVIYANGLDDYLVVNREDIERRGYEKLENYLHMKFNEVRDFYDDEISKKDVDYTEKYEELPPSLIKYPIRHAFETIIEKDIDTITIEKIENPENVNITESITDVCLEELTPEEPIAKYDLIKGIVKANTAHPFRHNFENEKSYQNWAIAEVLLELYMIEAGISPVTVAFIMKRRDRLLRVLVQKGPRPVYVISNMLRETTHIEKTFETACGDALHILGFNIVRLGQRGKPEGYATAHLGVDISRKPKYYKIVYDAKSTTSKAVQTGNLHISATKRHKKDYNVDYAIIIAPNFQDKQGDESAACKEASQNGIQLIRAIDLADLIDYSAVKSLPLTRLRDFFESCKTPQESADWIKRFGEEKNPVPPIRSLLDKIWEYQERDKKDAPTYGAIKEVCRDFLDEDWGINEIRDWLKALSRFVPLLIQAEDNQINLNQTPEYIVHQIIATINELANPKIGDDVIKAIT